ncbi:CoA-binding protein [Candidatus Micrarchaeota archaeon]|nr:CoA-binding protein [Candidatus Micrarchaeota archaeon]
MINLKQIFEPKSIAVIGASREPSKVGHAIVKNFVAGGFPGDIYPINPNATEILGLKCYKNVSSIKGKIDCAIIAIPAQFVPGALEECGKKGVRGIVLITGGFSEVGNVEGERQVAEIAKRYDLSIIGANCLGVLNPAARVDGIFLPVYKMARPRVGDIGFISQSGAVGGCIVDLAAYAGIGISKFVSYGNATVIDETHLLEYLGKDEKTRIIVMYLEGVRRGKEFIKVAKEIAKKKPIILLKAGVSKKGAEAVKSHTASLAGSAEAYRAVMKQCKIIEAKTLMELFYFAKIFDQPLPKGNRVGIVTNGGGYGVLATDAVELFELELANFSEESKKILRKNLPNYVNIRNPLDVVGDADSARYDLAINTLMEDPNVDIIVVVVLFQTVAIDSRVISVITRAADQKKKPIVVISTGGEYTEVHKRIFDSYGIPTYHSPTAALDAVQKFVWYADFLKKNKRIG